MINSNGELGTPSSSERFKTAIAPMGTNTAKLQQLRPVTFHYKANPQGTLRYDELAPMLLNEMQKQQRANAAQAAKIASLEAQLVASRRRS